MSNPTNICPTPETILKYFHMELDANELKEIEEHFSHCSQCLLEFDYYGNFVEQITLSSRVQKELWLNANTDTFSVAAADSYDNTGVSNLKSSDGKYILQKIPYLEDEHISLLVINLTNPDTQGRLSVYLLEDSTPVLIGSELIDEENKVCFEVDSDIQLKHLLITVV